jgi:hypothetical protein
MPATVALFFRGRPTARRLFAVVCEAIAAVGPSTMRITKSQIAFRRKRGFAWAWTPDRWLRSDTSRHSSFLSRCLGGFTRRGGRRSSSRSLGASCITSSYTTLEKSTARYVRGCSRHGQPRAN